MHAYIESQSKIFIYIYNLLIVWRLTVSSYKWSFLFIFANIYVMVFGAVTTVHEME